MWELTYTMPTTKEDWFIIGSYGEIQFQIPAVFDGDVLDTQASLLKIEDFKSYVQTNIIKE